MGCCEIHAVLRQKRDAISPFEREIISQQIQKVLRKIIRKHNDATLKCILEKFAELGKLDHISQNTKPKKYTKVHDGTNEMNIKKN